MYRLYWLSWRFYELVAGDETALYFYDIAWATYIPTLGVYIGASLMMAPITIHNFGRYWIAASVAIIVVLQSVGLLVIAVIKT